MRFALIIICSSVILAACSNSESDSSEKCEQEKSDTCAQSHPVSKAHLYVLSGQSNMVGIAPLTKDIINLYPMEVPNNVEYYFEDIRLTNFAQIIVDGVAYIGPEVSLIHELSRAHPSDKLIFIKVAYPGTSMKDWLPTYVDNSGAIKTNSNSLLLKSTKILDSLLSDRNYSLKYFFWMQGESDAIDYIEIGQKYLQNFSTLIKSFRDHFDAPDAPFVFGKILDFNESINLIPDGSVDGIRSAQEQIVSTVNNTHLINLDSLSIHDHWHYDGISQISFGRCLKAATEATGVRSNCLKLVNAPSQNICITGINYSCADIGINDVFGLWLLRLYLSHFGPERRCVDVNGLNYWRDKYENENASYEVIENIVRAFPATGWECQ